MNPLSVFRTCHIQEAGNSLHTFTASPLSETQTTLLTANRNSALCLTLVIQYSNELSPIVQKGLAISVYTLNPENQYNFPKVMNDRAFTAVALQGNSV
jgi:hypothetical protein